MNLIGKMLNNRYEILEKIGNGGMATVYKAKCHTLNRYVAVKILKDEFTTDSEFIKRFNTEAQAAASLTHPNIVSIYDVGNEGNLYYIVMELIQGKTLKEIIVEDGVLSWKWSVKIAIQIASALETAHKNGIIHRDIKPHNIIITEDGMAKVTDFGIAKAVSNSTMTAFGTTIGSVHYFSPEHARGGFTDAKSDLYSLGVVLYEMLTGRVPFDADTPVSVALKQVQEEPIEPIELNELIPISVNKIILKAMQKEPSMRYQSASEMLRDLSLSLKRPDEDFVAFNPNYVTSATQRIDVVQNNEKSGNATKRDNNKEEKKKGFFSEIREFYSKHLAAKIITFILVGAIAFLGAMWGTIKLMNSSRPTQVQIPNLAGANGEKALTKDEAIAKLKELGLEYEIVEVFDDTLEAGIVKSQKPNYQENYQINANEKITLEVSKGQKTVKLPSKMVGKTSDEVRAELANLDIDFEIIEETSDVIEEGYVTAVEPEEGTEIPATTKVKVHVSTGTGIVEVTVPNLVNKKEDVAKATLEGLNLVANIEYIEDKNKTEGIVLSQDEEVGTKLEEGSTVTIVVNQYAKMTEGTVTINVKSLTGYQEPKNENKTENTTNTVTNAVPTSTAETVKNVKLKVTVDNDTFADKEVKANSTNETVKIKAAGIVTVRVYIDGTVKATETMDLTKTTTLNIE